MVKMPLFAFINIQEQNENHQFPLELSDTVVQLKIRALNIVH